VRIAQFYPKPIAKGEHDSQRTGWQRHNSVRRREEQEINYQGDGGDDMEA